MRKFSSGSLGCKADSTALRPWLASASTPFTASSAMFMDGAEHLKIFSRFFNESGRRRGGGRQTQPKRGSGMLKPPASILSRRNFCDWRHGASFG